MPEDESGQINIFKSEIPEIRPYVKIEQDATLYYMSDHTLFLEVNGHFNKIDKMVHYRFCPACSGSYMLTNSVITMMPPNPVPPLAPLVELSAYDPPAPPP
jgi:hypothetical protein